MFFLTLVMALREVRRNTLRSILTGLGIVIGVAAVILMVNLGQSATAKVTADIRNFGNNMLTVIPGAQRRGVTSEQASLFTREDADAVKKQIPNALHVAPASSRGALVVFGNKNYSTSVQGSTLEFFAIRSLAIGRGRLFTETEIATGVPSCVLGTTVVKELFGAQDPLGAIIRVGKVNCKVIGVLVAKGQSTFGQDQDDFLVMPLVTFQRRLAGSNDVGAIYVSAVSEAVTERVKRQLVDLMRERRHIVPGQADDFSVMDMKEFTATLGTITGALTALLGAIASVSLLVGGIGIMNIMLVSVTERTREIGIRMAIGARAHEVLLQFLVEAVILSTMGGIIGMVLGLGGSYLAANGLGMPFVFDPIILGVAFGFSATVGIAFGYFPARRAARLKPIDALRHE